MTARITKQDYGTPRDFIEAVERRFGAIVCDLAAHAENAKCARYLSREDDSLGAPWADLYPEGNLWLNPEFADIDPWAAKCATEGPKREGLILMLTPASIGSNWFARHVHRKAFVLGLSPRLTFEGTTAPYPKDLMLSVYAHDLDGFGVWRWKP